MKEYTDFLRLQKRIIMTDPKEWNEVRNILCVRLDSLGDVLMTTPAMRALKETWPERKVTLLTSRSGANVASLIPEVDETIIYDPPWMKASAPPGNSTSEFQMIDQLKRSKFDATVIFTTFSQSPLPAALLTFMADIPLRLAHCRENPYSLLTHWVPESDHFNQSNIRHEVRRQLDLVASVNSRTTNEHLSLQVPGPSLENVHSLLRQICLDPSKPWLVLHPGATAASRRYPAESFAKVAQKLSLLYGFQIIFTGTEPEIELVETIRMNIPADSFSLAGQLDIGDLSALISIAPLLITNNTGPVHIAAALNTPVVDLYALTNSQHTPWMVPHRTLYHDVPCKFCYKSICPMGHHNCLRLVQPETVVEASLELFEARGGTEKTGID
jgi:lipopolysaccharide heptosyltransferase II